ncbi:MAG TPA: PQQ-binding-like beta-propeller repeat protein, partial [Spirochaetota bacterium]|nr:PQQ-binding-like beta-propeller repeat protein [Spirochaetota bacterium]
KTGNVIEKKKNETYDTEGGWDPFIRKNFGNYYTRENTTKFQVFSKSDNKKIIDIKKLFGLKQKLIDYTLLDSKNLLVTCEFEMKNKIVAYDLSNNGNVVYSIEFKYIDKPTFYGLGGDNIPRYSVFVDLDRFVIYNEKKDINVYKLTTGELVKENKDMLKAEKFTLYSTGEKNVYYYVTDNPSAVSTEPSGIKKINVETGDIIKDITLIEKGKYYLSGFLVDGNTALVAYQKYIAMETKDNVLFGVDIENSKILWQKKIPTIFNANMLTSDDGYFYFDDKSVYKIDKTTGNEIWSAKIDNAKTLDYDKNSKTLKVGIGLTKAKTFSEELSLIGIAKIDATNGNIAWKYDSPSPMSRIWNGEEGKIYFANRTSVIGLDTNNGNIVLKTEFDAKQKKDEIAAGFYLKNKNKMLLLRKETVSLLDIPTNKIEFTTSIKSKFFSSFLYAEIRVIGNYLFVTTVDNAVRSNNGVIPKTVWTIAINLKDGAIMWGVRSGFHQLTEAGAFFVYMDNLSTYGKGNTPINGLFYPRKELFKDNIMVIQTTKKDMAFEWFTMGIKVFPEDALPTEDELKNEFTDLGMSVTKKSFKVERMAVRKMASFFNNLW